MNEAEVAERFIRAAETDRRRQVRGTRPTAYGSAMPAYVHTAKDMNGWGRRAGEKDQLLPEDTDRHAAHRREFWEGATDRPSAADITALEECERWAATILTDDGQRRALWAWAHSKAGGRAFNGWCFKVERIHPETGRRRKDRAISQITCEIGGKPFQNNEMQALGVLPEGPVSPYLPDTVEGREQTEPRDFSWRSDPSLRPVFKPDDLDTTWADRQNERRRQREQRARRSA